MKPSVGSRSRQKNVNRYVHVQLFDNPPIMAAEMNEPPFFARVCNFPDEILFKVKFNDIRRSMIFFDYRNGRTLQNGTVRD